MCPSYFLVRLFSMLHLFFLLPTFHSTSQPFQTVQSFSLSAFPLCSHRCSCSCGQITCTSFVPSSDTNKKKDRKHRRRRRRRRRRPGSLLIPPSLSPYSTTCLSYLPTFSTYLVRSPSYLPTLTSHPAFLPACLALLPSYLPTYLPTFPQFPPT